jgi:hypothetical protein
MECDGRATQPGIIILGHVTGDVSIFDRPSPITVRIELINKDAPSIIAPVGCWAMTAQPCPRQRRAQLDGRSEACTANRRSSERHRRTTALAFAREGAHIVAADLSERGSQETARMIEDAGGRSRSDAMCPGATK